MAQWQVSREGKTFGPFDDDQLRDMAASGKLKPTDHVWAEGMKDWVEARKVKSLFKATSSPPPPPPAPGSAPSPTTPASAPTTSELEADFASTGMRHTHDNSDQPGGRARGGNQRSKLPRILAMLFVLLILAGGGFLVAKQMGGGANHLQYMPDDMSLYMHFDLDSLQGTEAWSMMQTEVRDLKKMTEELQERTGFRPDDLRSMTTGIVLSGEKGGVAVFQFSRPLEMLEDAKVEQSEIEGYTVYQDRRMAFALIGSGTVVMAEPHILTEVLKRDGRPELTPEMKNALSNASGSQVSIAMDFKAMRGLVKNKKSIFKTSNLFPGSDAIIGKIDSGCITAKVGSNAQVHAVVHCEDSDTAEAIETLASGGIAAFKLQLPNERIPEEFKELIGDTLDTFEINASGDEVSASIDVPLIELIKKMPKD